MRRTLRPLVLPLALPAVLLLASAGAATAQGAPPAPVAAPDPAALKAARDVVAKMQGDRGTVLSSMSAPMVGLMQQMGVREPDRAQALVQEVVLPVMTAHYDELIDMQARNFASVLGTADLQAIGTFYDTPAGKALAKAQPQLAQAQLTGMTQWMGTLMPEMQGKIVQTMKAHGWDKPPAKK